MNILVPLLWLALGLGLLVFGGDLLVRGAIRLSRTLGMSAAVAGLTVVALGTSAPELVVSLIAAWRGNTDIAVGNVIGSNIFNICAVLGLCALIRPLRVAENTVRLVWPFLFLSTLVACFLFQDGAIDASEGMFFLLSLVLFLAYMVRLARKKATPEEGAEDPKGSLARHISLVVGGSILLMVGARWMLDGAVDIAQLAGMTDRVIGLTIVGAGTGLPELTASIVAIARRHDDLAIANILGSNAFNILWILGSSSLIRPLHVDPQLISFDNWWMAGVTFLLFPLMRRGFRLVRWEGGLLLAIYIGYISILLTRG